MPRAGASQVRDEGKPMREQERRKEEGNFKIIVVAHLPEGLPESRHTRRREPVLKGEPSDLFK